MYSVERFDCNVCRSSEAKFRAQSGSSSVNTCEACAPFVLSGFRASRREASLIPLDEQVPNRTVSKMAGEMSGTVAVQEVSRP